MAVFLEHCRAETGPCPSKSINTWIDSAATFRSTRPTKTCFQEYVDQRSAVAIPTVALHYLTRELDAENHSLVILTGDAGHGKTHLCAKVLEHFGLPADNVAATLLTRCDGAHNLVELPSGRPLRMIKDLSELAPPRARRQNYVRRTRASRVRARRLRERGTAGTPCRSTRG